MASTPKSSFEFKRADDDGTQPGWKDGYAEELIGNYIKVNKNNIYIATKFSPINASKKLLKQKTTFCFSLPIVLPLSRKRKKRDKMHHYLNKKTRIRQATWVHRYTGTLFPT